MLKDLSAEMRQTLASAYNNNRLHEVPQWAVRRHNLATLVDTLLDLDDTMTSEQITVQGQLDLAYGSLVIASQDLINRHS